MIDWFTVGAQLLNFLILVALLKHFLYGPVTRAMDEREEAIRSRLQEADEKLTKAEQEAADYQAKRAEFEDRRDRMLDEARQDADRERKERLRRAREDVDAMAGEWKAAVQQEKNEFLADLRRGVGRQSVTVARRALEDLADVALQQQLTAAFVSRLDHLDDQQRTELAATLSEPDARAVIRTTFEPTPDERRQVEQALASLFNGSRDVSFERSDDLICGIEWVAGGRKLGWTLAGYLEDVSSQVEKTLNQTGSAPEEKQDAGDDRA